LIGCAAVEQVYGRNRGSANAKGRWLARGVETLLYQYPGLRVSNSRLILFLLSYYQDSLIRHSLILLIYASLEQEMKTGRNQPEIVFTEVQVCNL